MDGEGRALDDPSAASQAELKELAGSLEDTQPAGALVAKCRTLDQVGGGGWGHGSCGCLDWLGC